MWIRSIIVVLLLTTLLGCNEQRDQKIQIVQSTEKPKLPTVLVEELQLYKVGPLLSDLMSAIVLSNRRNYSSDKYFYILTWGSNKMHRQLTITAMPRDEPQAIDHNGIVQIDGMRFLINGDIEQDETFFKKEPNKKIRVRILKCNKDDNIPLPIEPILQGLIKSEAKVPVYVEVYTKSAIKGYEMALDRKKINP